MWGAVGSLVELLEEAAERMPDAVAVVYEEENLTYREFHGKGTS